MDMTLLPHACSHLSSFRFLWEKQTSAILPDPSLHFHIHRNTHALVYILIRRWVGCRAHWYCSPFGFGKLFLAYISAQTQLYLVCFAETSNPVPVWWFFYRPLWLVLQSILFFCVLVGVIYPRYEAWRLGLSLSPLYMVLIRDGVWAYFLIFCMSKAPIIDLANQCFSKFGALR